MDLKALRAIGPEKIINSDELFALIEQASAITLSDKLEDSSAIEIAVRLLDAAERGMVPHGSTDAIYHLADECGLMHYVDESCINPFKRIIYESSRIHLSKTYILHAKQLEALSHLLNGENVILSAPTSFGKSILVDAFISDGDLLATSVIHTT
jgi:ATP-dependent helicase YprA (DUF1998 family)